MSQFPNFSKIRQIMAFSKNFIQIQGWMITELHLYGNELIIFSILYLFCQDGSSKSISRKYLSTWLLCIYAKKLKTPCKKVITKCLHSLEKKGFIRIVKNPGRWNTYSINKEVIQNITKHSDSNKTTQNDEVSLEEFNELAKELNI